jgi:hypothetical protein
MGDPRRPTEVPRRARGRDVTTTDNDTGATAAEGKPRRSRALPLILVGLGALLVGGIVGALIGWQVEKNRVEDDLENIRPVARVTRVDDESITIALPAGGTRSYVVSDATDVATTAAGEPSDLEEGARVFVRGRGNSDGDLEATEIVILPSRDGSAED